MTRTHAKAPKTADSTRVFAGRGIRGAHDLIAQKHSGIEQSEKAIGLAQLARKLAVSAPLRAKLWIGKANDPKEREADEMANSVMRMTAPPLRRACTACAEQDLRRSASPMAGNQPVAAPADVARGVRSLRGRGQPLSPSLRSYYEPRFGHSFENVRLHTDPGSGEIARKINARAFAYGNDIAFAPGEYQPETKQGKWLLAHELAHVVQNGPGSTRGTVSRAKANTRETAGGCGICFKEEYPGNTAAMIGNAAHYAIQTDIIKNSSGTVATEFMAYGNHKRGGKRPDVVWALENGVQMAEIKPDTEHGSQGISDLADRLKWLQMQYPNRIVTLRPMGPGGTTQMFDMRAFFAGCALQKLHYRFTAPGFIQYWCDPPFSKARRNCDCRKKRKRQPEPKPFIVPQEHQKRELQRGVEQLLADPNISPGKIKLSPDTAAFVKTVGYLALAALLVYLTPVLLLKTAIGFAVIFLTAATAGPTQKHVPPAA